MDNNHAIAFYESSPSGNVSFGSAIMKKGILGWESLGSFSSQVPEGYKLDWGYSNVKQRKFVDYTDLLRGKILEPEREKIKIITAEGNEYEAKIVEYNNNDRLWFLITEGEDLQDVTLIGVSQDGKIIEEL